MAAPMDDLRFEVRLFWFVSNVSFGGLILSIDGSLLKDSYSRVYAPPILTLVKLRF